jgi:hypothetical protein
MRDSYSDASLIRVIDHGGVLLFRSKSMLKVNVGLSRKLSRDYNSTGFSLNLEGEICVGLDDPEAMIEKVKEFYDLAEEALNQQIERYEGESAIGSRDGQQSPRSNGQSNGTAAKEPANNPTPNSHEGNGHTNHNGNGQATNGDIATNKQVQYLLNLGKRQGLTPPQLEGRIESILGKKVGVYDLTKREAGDVIDALSQNGAPATNGNGRNRVSR